MKIRIIVSLLFTYFCSTPAIAGGISGGGGGSNEIPSLNLIPVGIVGALLATGNQVSMDNRVKDVLPNYRGPIIPCSNGKSVLMLPKPFSDYFKLSYLRENEAPFDDSSKEKICSNEKLIDSINSFSLAVADIFSRDPSDGPAKTLIERIYALGGPILLVLKPGKTEVIARGGAIAESAYFDFNTGKIFWSSRDLCQGLGCLGFRRDQDVLAHELAHLFLFRALGDKHPKESYWHDIRFKDIADEYSDEKIMLSETSESAAFIEGLANTLERTRYSINHPFKARDFSMHSLTEEGCYYVYGIGLKNAWKKFAQIPFQAPTSSEVYVSSSLDRLMEAFEPGSAAEKGELNPDTNFIVKSINGKLMTSLIGAIENYKPTDLPSLARAIDAVTEEHLGRRWLREYFFLEYVTGKKMGAEFNRKDGKVCGGKRIYTSSLRFILEQQQEQAERRAHQLHSLNVTNESLIKDMSETREKLQRDIQSLIKDYGSPKLVEETLHKKLEKNMAICKSIKSLHENYENPLSNSIYEWLLKHRTDVSLMEIVDSIESACKRQHKIVGIDNLVTRKEKQIQAMAEKLGGTSDKRHSQHVEDWLKLKQKALESIEDFTHYYMSAVAINALLAD